MLKQLVIMFVLSILFSLALESQSIESLRQAGLINIYQIIGYAIGHSIILMLLSIIFALIPRGFYWLLKKKRAPDFAIFAWSMWIILIIFFTLGQINKSLSNIDKNPTTSSQIEKKHTAQTVYHIVEKSIYSIYAKDKNNKIVSIGGAVSVSEEYLATNCHIIKDEDHFTIETTHGEKPGILYSEHGDLCIITALNTQFSPAKIRPSKSVSIGEEVYAIGNPEGLDKSISDGIISNKHDIHGMILLQTNAAISPGSSGGGLFDDAGNLIGITTLKLTDKNDEGIGFVIPTETIQAAILEPRINQAKDVEPSNSSATVNVKAPLNTEYKILGIYGKSKIALVDSHVGCFIAIPGNYNKQQTSFAIWLPDIPNTFYIFSIVTQPANVLRFFAWMLEVPDESIQYLESKSYIYFNKTLSPLAIISINAVKQPVYVFSKKNIAEDFITLDYFIAQFYNYIQDGGMTTITFGLDGFTEALGGYNRLCHKP